MLDAALAYARHGIPVLPLHAPALGGRCSCGRATCERPGKHPRLRHGLTEASTDPLTIEAWWARWPEANIGLRTGTAMDVADVDSAEGWHGLRHLLGGELPPGPQVRTGGGGWHFWFRPSGRGNRVRVVPGLDWRGLGGYVVAPPSRHASGSTYDWVVRPGAGLPPVPPELAEMIAGPEPPRSINPTPPRHPFQYAAAALAAESERVARAPVGARNDTLNRAAFALGRLVAAGVADAAAVTRELTAAAAWAGLGRAETGRTIRSGLTAGIRVGPPPGIHVGPPAGTRVGAPAGTRVGAPGGAGASAGIRVGAPGEIRVDAPGGVGVGATPGIRVGAPGGSVRSDVTRPRWPVVTDDVPRGAAGEPDRGARRGPAAIRREISGERGRDRVA